MAWPMVEARRYARLCGQGGEQDAPSGNRPFSPVSVFLPRNQPSPKSSSRSMSSMRSPRLRLSSSGLRATNSSVWGGGFVVNTAVQGGVGAGGEGRDLRTTTRVSPGRQPSVWERWAMGAGVEAWAGRGVCAVQQAGVVMACSGGSHQSVWVLHVGMLDHWGWVAGRAAAAVQAG